MEFLRKQAKKRSRESRRGLSRVQHEIAREYGFATWSEMVRRVQAARLDGIERALVLADPTELAVLLRGGAAVATTPVGDLPPLLVLLRRSIGSAADVRACTQLLLDAGADADSHTIEWDGQGPTIGPVRYC